MGLLRWLIVRSARFEHPSAQFAVDRLVHILLQHTMPPLFERVEARYSLARYRACMAPHSDAIDFASTAWQALPMSGFRRVFTPHARVLRAPRDRQRPLLIWHHGAGEFPVDATIGNAYQSGTIDLPLVVVRATGHHRYRTYQHQMRFGRGAAAMLAASVTAVESVRRSWDGPVIVGGLSLGGLVAALHADWYGADAPEQTCWAPLAAGPDLPAVLLRSGFARLTAPGTKRAHQVEDMLSDGISAQLTPAVARRVYPLLGRWDLVYTLRHQAAAWRRWGVTMRVVARSHIGLAVDGVAIAEHLMWVARRLSSDEAHGVQVHDGDPGSQRQHA